MTVVGATKSELGSFIATQVSKILELAALCLHEAFGLCAWGFCFD